MSNLAVEKIFNFRWCAFVALSMYIASIVLYIHVLEQSAFAGPFTLFNATCIMPLDFHFFSD